MHEGNLKSWSIWLVAGIFYLFEFIHRVVVSIMIPELGEAFGVGSAMLSNLSAAYFFAYALAQIPVGILIDRYSTRTLLSLACFAIAISSMAFAYSESYILASYCRIIIGLGSAFAFVGCLKLAADWFPAYKFAFIVGLTNLLGVVGAIIGGSPLASAVEVFGWRSVMYGSGVIGLFITALLLHILPRINTNKNTTKIRHLSKRAVANNASTTQITTTLWFRNKSTKLLANLIIVIKDKQTWLIALFAGCMVAPIVSYSELWGVTYLTNVYNLSRPLAAHITTFTFIGIAIGGPSIGWLSDYFRKRTIFMFIGMFGSVTTISLILFGPIMQLWIIYILHISFGVFTSSMLLCFTLNSEATLPKIRATTIAFTNCIIMLAGAGLQSISGYLLTYTNGNYNTSFIPLISCYILATICLIYIKEPPCKFADE